MRHKSISLSAVGIAIAIVAGGNLPVGATTFDGLVFFGDSLVDQGNFLPLTGGTFPNSPYYFPGRFSNGLVFSDYLAEDLGLSSNVINYALGGGTTGSGNISQIPGAVGLQQQISAFLNGTNLFGEPVNFSANSLYTLWSGPNDYLPIAGLANESWLRKVIVSQTIFNLSFAVGALAVSGAGDILVPNLPDLSKTPLAAGTDPQSQQNLKHLVRLHNKYLAATLKVFRIIFPNTNFISFNSYRFFDRILTNPEEFGFTNTTQACTKTNLYDPVNTFPDPFNIYNSGCNEAVQNSYIWWDSVHPNTRVHELIADSILTRLNQDSSERKLNIEGTSLAPLVAPAARAEIVSTTESTSSFCLLAFGVTGGVVATMKRQRK